MTDKIKSLIERAETVLKMIECCNEHELCSECPYEYEPECHPLTTAKEIIVEMMGKMLVWHDYPDDPPKEFGEYVVLIADGIEESFDIGEYG